MSQSEKKLRKAFLNDLCTKFGIDNPTDPRRSHAAIAFIAYGERQCREWLAQSNGSYAHWKGIVDIKQARKLVSKKHRARKTLSPRSDSRVRAQKKALRDSPHKVGGRMKVGRYKYLVGPDGVVTTWKPARPIKEYELDRI